MTETSTATGGEPTSTERPIGGTAMPSLEVVVACVGVALALAYVPFMFLPSYTPRLALVAVLCGTGIVSVVNRSAGGDGAARAALVLSAWIVASAILSGHAFTSLIGVFGRESSALIMVGSVMAWGAAREVGSAGRHLFERLLVLALVANAFVGLIQIVFNIESGSFQLYGGRATGLLVSHVAFGACMAGAGALVAARTDVDRDGRYLWLIAFFAAAANLSGSRGALAAGLVAIAAVSVIRRPRWRAVFPIASYLGGLVASVLATAFVLPGESATERATAAGTAGRLDAWGYGIQAMLDRPVFGWGPGRFRAAVQGRFSAEFSGANARDEVTQIWWDAHNIVVNTVVTLGVVGLALALAFGYLVVRKSRGPLVWFAAVVASSWLLQPAGLATLPLIMFCLGAATVSTSFERSESSSTVSDRGVRGDAARTGLLVGVVLALLFVLADVHVKVAIESLSAEEVASAAGHLPWDPVVADLASEAYIVYGSGPSALDEATRWSQEAVDRESDRPYYLNRLAELQLAGDRTELARVTLAAAQREQPWNVRTWLLLGVVAERSDDDELRRRVADANCALDELMCGSDD